MMDDNRAQVTWVDDITGEKRTRVYYAPYSGGYVRTGPDGDQVCEGLGYRGVTLLWSPDQGPLQDLIDQQHEEVAG